MVAENLARYLEQNPKMMGALFTICLLLAQATPVIAGDGCSCGGN